MSDQSVPLSDQGLLSTRASDGRIMLGHLIVCRGAGHDDVDALAVWQVSTEGINTGAWVVPTSDALTHPETARRVLSTCVQRAIVAWDPSEAIEVLHELEQVAETDPIAWASSAVRISDALAEIAEVRAAYEKRVAEEQAVKKNVLALEWNLDLPDPLPDNLDALRRVARPAQPVGACPVATSALETSRLLRWAVERWQETMTALGRREYLRATFGQPQVLPDVWETRVADAFATQRGRP